MSVKKKKQFYELKKLTAMTTCTFYGVFFRKKKKINKHTDRRLRLRLSKIIL